MMANTARSWGSVIAVTTSLLLLGACEGRLDKIDARVGQVDTGTVSDTSAPDTSATLEAGPQEAAAGDGAADIGSQLDGGPVGVCASWSGWTCSAGPSPYLCKATCQTGAKSYALSCTSTGHCVCGIATGPCGPFTFSQACDACKQAISCCLP